MDNKSDIQQIIDKLNEFSNNWENVGNVLDKIANSLQKLSDITNENTESILSKDNITNLSKNIDNLSVAANTISSIDIKNAEHCAKQVNSDIDGLTSKISVINNEINSVDTKLAQISVSDFNQQLQILNMNLKLLETQINDSHNKMFEDIKQNINNIKNEFKNNKLEIEKLNLELNTERNKIYSYLTAILNENKKTADLIDSIRQITKAQHQEFSELMKQWYKENVRFSSITLKR